jgi:hypothetical protein
MLWYVNKEDFCDFLNQPHVVTQLNTQGFIVDLFITWLVVRFKETAPLWLLLVGAAGQGLGGSSKLNTALCLFKFVKRKALANQDLYLN